jgi:hypothetical protein
LRGAAGVSGVSRAGWSGRGGRRPTQCAARCHQPNRGDAPPQASAAAARCRGVPRGGVRRAAARVQERVQERVFTWERRMRREQAWGTRRAPGLPVIQAAVQWNSAGRLHEGGEDARLGDSPRAPPHRSPPPPSPLVLCMLVTGDPRSTCTRGPEPRRDRVFWAFRCSFPHGQKTHWYRIAGRPTNVRHHSEQLRWAAISCPPPPPAAGCATRLRARWSIDQRKPSGFPGNISMALRVGLVVGHCARALTARQWALTAVDRRTAGTCLCVC